MTLAKSKEKKARVKWLKQPKIVAELLLLREKIRGPFNLLKLLTKKELTDRSIPKVDNNRALTQQ